MYQDNFWTKGSRSKKQAISAYTITAYFVLTCDLNRATKPVKVYISFGMVFMEWKCDPMIWPSIEVKLVLTFAAKKDNVAFFIGSQNVAERHDDSWTTFMMTTMPLRTITWREKLINLWNVQRAKPSLKSNSDEQFKGGLMARWYNWQSTECKFCTNK